MGLMDDTFVMT